MKYPASIADLSDKERRRVINQMPKSALVKVMAGAARYMLFGGILYEELLMLTALKILRDKKSAIASIRKLQPRVLRVKNHRANQPLILRWNRTLKKYESATDSFDDLMKIPCVRRVFTPTKRRSRT